MTTVAMASTLLSDFCGPDAPMLVPLIEVAENGRESSTKGALPKASGAGNQRRNS
jgi:hypothetical protein